MSIKVQIGDAAEGSLRIESNPEGLLKLPSILVEQINKVQPPVWIKRVRAGLKGDALGLQVLGPAYASGAVLKLFDPPHKLTQPMELFPLTVHLGDQKFPPGEYLLRVEVIYQQPPAFPGAKPGKDTAVIAERFLEVPSDIGRKCALTIRWTHQELIVGQTAAEMTIVAEHLPREVMPTVRVYDPNKVLLPALRDALNQQLKLLGPKLLGDHDPAGRTLFEQTIPFRFDAPERQAAVRQAAAGGLAIELRIAAIMPMARGASGQPEQVAIASVNLEGDDSLRIDFPENMFPGYPVLDLGTSSTFALISYSQLQAGLIPVEQEQTFRGTLMNWFGRKDGLFVSKEWQSLLADALKRLGAADRTVAEPAAGLRDYLKKKPPAPAQSDTTVHSMLRALEMSALMPNFSADFRLNVRREFSEMYARAFRRFPLQKQRLLAVELDLNRAPDESPEGAGAIVEPIPSTVQVISCHPLEVDIGPEADANRLEAGAANPAALLTQYHSSPKNFYPLLGQPGESVTVSSGGAPVKVTPREFLVATLKRIRERIDQYRKKADKVPMKRFGKIVMPFPTSAPLSVRQEILVAAREAGFDRPIADLDEALSAAVFYLVNPFGADLEMGLEAFRTSCRPVFKGEGVPPTEWDQNILLIDIGGGTTDIALIEVKLTDKQAKGAGDGSKGRYYQLTPKLLGATGRAQLAGNLLSLGVYHALKKRIADAVLSAVDPSASTAADGAGLSPEESLNAMRLLQSSANVHPKFKDDQGRRYRPGALLDHYLTNQLWNDDGEPLASHAFNLANQVLSTAWAKATDEASRSASARTFYALWGLADEVKVKIFGKKRRENADDAAAKVDGYTVTQEQIGRLIGIPTSTCEQLGIPALKFGIDSFQEAVDPPLLEIAHLALDLAKTRLRSETHKSLAADSQINPLILDRVILTGQTCRLPRVREIVTETFQKESERDNSGIRWDPTALVFEGHYAKQAAALGAAYAQTLRENRVPPNVHDALNGNVLDVDVQNLFFFLQSGFWVRDPSDASYFKTLLTPGLAFTDFDADGVGHLRSPWSIQPRETLLIDRFDFDGDGGMPWGSFDCKILAESIALPFRSFQDEVRMAIETDHRLVVNVLFCRGSERHYELPKTTDLLDVAAALEQMMLFPSAPLPTAAPAAKPAPTAKLAAAPRASIPVAAAVPATPRDWLAPLAGWVLGINVQGGYGASLFRLSRDEFDKTFRSHGARNRRGRESVELPACPENGIDKYYIRPADQSRDWIQIGEMRRPVPQAGQRVSTRAILDETGQLRVHLGELPFWLAGEDAKLLDSGTVLRKPLTSPELKPDDLRNPFCGRH